MRKLREVECKNDGCNNRFILYNSLQPYCSASCKKSHMDSKGKKTYINPVSEKRKKENPIYNKKRSDFLNKPENKFCKIRGSRCTTIATTIEHSAGRLGFASPEKRDLGISLFIDEDFFIPACNNCNLELENNPELSRKHQVSKIHNGKKLKK